LRVEAGGPDRCVVGHSPPEGGVGQVSLAEIGASKIGQIQSGAVKPGPGEICGCQIGRAQIGIF